MNNHTSVGVGGLAGQIIPWKVLQIVFYLIGWTIFLFLIFNPDIGITLLWNILIPVAPALLVLGTGLWRNVCPLATTALLPDALKISRGKTLAKNTRQVLNLFSLVILFLVVPLRHLVFNSDGLATAILLAVIASMALITGYFFERKSGWCSGLCPVNQVELLYGSSVAFSAPNLHCTSCVRCSVPCPDSTTNQLARNSKSSFAGQLNEYLIIGFFPGFIWGWFHVPDYAGALTTQKLLNAYAYPIEGGIATLALFFLVRLFTVEARHEVIGKIFAASAVSCYYWYRLPQLFGFGTLESEGILIDATQLVPASISVGVQVAVVLFFFWWMVVRRSRRKSWSPRPRYAG